MQSLVSIFVESGLGASRKDTDSAKTFLNEQIKSFEAKLEEAETRLKEFRCATSSMPGRRRQGRRGAAGRDQRPARCRASCSCAKPRTCARRRQAPARPRKARPAAARRCRSLMQESSASTVATPELDARLDREAQPRHAAAALHRPAPRHHRARRKLIKDLEDQKQEGDGRRAQGRS